MISKPLVILVIIVSLMVSSLQAEQLEHHTWRHEDRKKETLARNGVHKGLIGVEREHEMIAKNNPILGNLDSDGLKLVIELKKLLGKGKKVNLVVADTTTQ